MPAVLNKRTMRPGQKGQYCGRGSKWGNRNRMMTEADRNAVCDQHEIDLYHDNALLRALDDLRGGDLIYFCAPKRCHCDLLLRLANATRQERIDWFLAVRRNWVRNGNIGRSVRLLFELFDGCLSAPCRQFQSSRD